MFNQLKGIMMKAFKLKEMKKVKWFNGALILMVVALLFNGCHDIENEIENDLPLLKSAETVQVAGDVFLSPVKFIRGTENPVVETLSLDENGVENFAPDFMLHLKNGDENGNRVSSAIVKLDGKSLFGPSDFSQQVEQLSVPVTGITSESVLEVEVRGEPGGFVEIWIEGTLLEEENTYKMYFTSLTQGLFGVNDDDTQSALYQYEGRLSMIKEHNRKLYVHAHSFSLDEWAIHVLDLEGNLLEILEFPEEVTWSAGFTILPDGRFAVYNNDDDEVYFLNSDFSYQTKIAVAKNGSRQVMKGIVVGNDLILCENGFQKLLKIDLNTYDVTEFRDFSHLNESFLASLAYSDGIFYLGGRNNIYSFKEGEPEKLVATLPTVANVDIEVDGKYAFVASNFGGKIYQIDLSDGSFSDFISLILNPQDIEIVK